MSPSPMAALDALPPVVGVLGASGPVARRVLHQLVAQGRRVVACTRQPGPPPELTTGAAAEAIQWVTISGDTTAEVRALAPELPLWIAPAPVWTLPQHADMLQAMGARRVVWLSSTSRYGKTSSDNPEEQALVRRLIEGEQALRDWAEARGVAWTVLRPTLIYGRGRDRNVSDIAAIIRRLGVFPLLGGARGLRQPVHVDDVATAGLQAAVAPAAANRAYNLSGADRLAYRDMVARVFQALGRPVRFLPVPLFLFHLAMGLASRLHRYQHWNADMARRMNQDMAYDHDEAARDFGFAPRPFRPSPDDLAPPT